MEEKDLYKILGVERGASSDDVKSAYRKLAREHHPDVNPNDPKAEDRFKEISAAYTVLSDDDKRARYDEFGMAGLQDGFDPEQARSYQQWSRRAGRSPAYQEGFQSDMDLEDLLSQFFQGAQTAAGPRPGGDAIGDIQIDFLDAVRGGEISVEFEGKGRLRVKIPPAPTRAHAFVCPVRASRGCRAARLAISTSLSTCGRTRSSRATARTSTLRSPSRFPSWCSAPRSTSRHPTARSP